MIVKISRAFNEIFTIISYQNGQLSPCAQPPPLTRPLLRAGRFRGWPYVARPLDARKAHQVFLRGRKNDVVQRGKESPRPLGLRRTAHVRSDAAPPRARAPDSPHPRPPPAHSAPAILPSVGRACPRPPQAGYARNVQSSTQIKKLSAEFARSAKNCNKIPPGGVYVGRD